MTGGAGEGAGNVLGGSAMTSASPAAGDKEKGVRSNLVGLAGTTGAARDWAALVGSGLGSSGSGCQAGSDVGFAGTETVSGLAASTGFSAAGLNSSVAVWGS